MASLTQWSFSFQAFTQPPKGFDIAIPKNVLGKTGFWTLKTLKEHQNRIAGSKVATIMLNKVEFAF